MTTKEMYEEYLLLNQQINFLLEEFDGIDTEDKEVICQKWKEIDNSAHKKSELESEIYNKLDGKCLKLDNGNYLIAYSNDGVASFEEVELIEE